jgi:hypothetical protein
LVGLYLVVGSAKLLGLGTTVALFDAVGFGQGFRYVVGATEVFAAILIARSSTVWVGVGILIFLMFGAIGTEVFTLHRVPVLSAATLAAILVFARTLRQRR